MSNDETNYSTFMKIEDVIIVIFNMFRELVEGNDPLNYTYFDYNNGKINIGIKEYVKQVYKKSKEPIEVLLIAGIYIKKLQSRLYSIKNVNGVAHRIFLTSFILAHKYHDDTPHNFKDLINFGYVFNKKIMIKCEIEMLKLLDYRLFVQPYDVMTTYTNFCYI